MLLTYLVASYVTVGCLACWQWLLADDKDLKTVTGLACELVFAPAVFAVLVLLMAVVMLMLAVVFAFAWLVASMTVALIVLVATGAAFSSFGSGDLVLERGGRS